MLGWAVIASTAFVDLEGEFSHEELFLPGHSYPAFRVAQSSAAVVGSGSMGHAGADVRRALWLDK